MGLVYTRQCCFIEVVSASARVLKLLSTPTLEEGAPQLRLECSIDLQEIFISIRKASRLYRSS